MCSKELSHCRITHTRWPGFSYFLLVYTKNIQRKRKILRINKCFRLKCPKYTFRYRLINLVVRREISVVTIKVPHFGNGFVRGNNLWKLAYGQINQMISCKLYNYNNQHHLFENNNWCVFFFIQIPYIELIIRKRKKKRQRKTRALAFWGHRKGDIEMN